MSKKKLATFLKTLEKYTNIFILVLHPTADEDKNNDTQFI